MKTLMLLSSVILLTSCGTDPQGNKTFLNKTGKQWGSILSNTGKRSVPILQEEYENSNLTSSK